MWSVGVRKLREAEQVKLHCHTSTSGWVEDISSGAVNGVAVEELKAFKGKLTRSVNPHIECAQSCEDSLREGRLTGTVASNCEKAVSGTACISVGEKDCPKDPRATVP